MTTQGIITALISIAALAVNAALIRANRKNLAANTDNTLVLTASQVAKELRLELDRIRERLNAEIEKREKLESLVQSLSKDLAFERARKYQIESWSKVLFSEVVEAGGTPTPLDQIPLPKPGEIPHG